MYPSTNIGNPASCISHAKNSHSYLNVSEAGGHVNGHVLVALLEPVVLLDVVKVVAADHHSVLHLKGVWLGTIYMYHHEL